MLRHKFGTTVISEIDFLGPLSARSGHPPLLALIGMVFLLSEVKIDRLDLSARDLSEWRFCQRCAHVEKEVIAKSFEACPKCDDEMWTDAGSAHEAIELKTVIAVTSEQKASIRDADDRQNKQYDRAMFPFYVESAIEQAWASVTASTRSWPDVSTAAS